MPLYGMEKACSPIQSRGLAMREASIFNQSLGGMAVGVYFLRQPTESVSGIRCCHYCFGEVGDAPGLDLRNYIWSLWMNFRIASV